jgi:hypothetical protein
MNWSAATNVSDMRMQSQVPRATLGTCMIIRVGKWPGLARVKPSSVLAEKWNRRHGAFSSNRRRNRTLELRRRAMRTLA